MKDLEERDALAERLKLKDKEKTRNIMERPDKKVQVSYDRFFDSVVHVYSTFMRLSTCTWVCDPVVYNWFALF